MTHFKRILNLPDLLNKKSFFLFGPRSTGKSRLIKNQLQDAVVYDLLDAQVYRSLVIRPKIIEERCTDTNQIIVIDEIQKIPALLDEVHRLIENRGLRFLLTGSSARKLRRGGANLLAGRAWTAALFPLVTAEIPNYDLLKILNYGTLPQVVLSKYPEEELKNYIGTYLKEEIQAEALTRNVNAFAEFLDLVGLSNGHEINYESFANDCQASTTTIKNYFQILEDTLIGFSLPGFTKSKKRKGIARAKHYLFDIGVANQLGQRGTILEKSEAFGNALEHLIVSEVRAYLSYCRLAHELSYWRTTSQYEVDLLIGKKVAIEIKSTSSVTDRTLKGLKALKEEGIFTRYIVVSLDPERRVIDDTFEIFPVKQFLAELWRGGITN